MYSRSHPIGRAQIFAAFAEVLAELAGVAPGPAERIAEQELEGCEYIGYYAARLRYRIAAGEAALICDIDPILATMGVSGEHHAWRSEGLAGDAQVRGTALSSGRQPSFAELVVDGVDEPRAAELGRQFRAALSPIMTPAELEQELAKR